jgi:hypothetical protein
MNYTDYNVLQDESGLGSGTIIPILAPTTMDDFRGWT